MIILGLIALIAGLLLGIYILWVIGLILIILGLVLWFVPIGAAGSRRTHHWY